MKKLLAVFLAVLMLFALSATAFADPATLDEGIHDNEANTDNAASSSVLILKELVIYNYDGAKIYLPAATYTYTIAPYDVDATDAEGVYSEGDTTDIMAPVYTGDSSALLTTSATVNFATMTAANSYNEDGTPVDASWAQPVAAPASGASVYGGFEIKFDPEAFPHAGVYRYVITESATRPYDKSQYGIVNGEDPDHAHSDFDYEVRYLDVYVRSADSDGDDEYDSTEIYGYVCFAAGADGADESWLGYDVTSGFYKTNGFVHADDDIAVMADQYRTLNFVIGKIVDTAGRTPEDHAFPVTFAFDGGMYMRFALGRTETDSSLKSSVVPSSAYLNLTATSMTASDDIIDAASSATIQVDLADGQHFNLNGYPVDADTEFHFQVMEQNDTYDTYVPTLEWTGRSGDQLVLAGSRILFENVNQISNMLQHEIYVLNKDDVAVALDLDSRAEDFTDDSVEIWFTNTLVEVSPTGVLIRIAPYGLILAAGLLLVFVAKRRKASDEA